MSQEDRQLGLFDGAKSQGQDTTFSEEAPERPTAQLLERTGHELLALADRVAGALEEETDLDETLPHLAAELVAMATGLDDEQARALFWVVLASLVHLQSGSTRMPLDWSNEGVLARRLGPIRGLDELDRLPTLDNIATAFETIVDEELAEDILGEPGDYTPLVLKQHGEHGRHLYHQRMYHYETRLVDAVRARLETDANLPATPTPGESDELADTLREVVAEHPLQAGDEPMHLNAEQQYALLTVCYSPLTIVTGGPGTGKTSLVVNLLRLAVRRDIAPDDIALAAPTGKAATRLREAVDGHLSQLDELTEPDRRIADTPLEAKTLHRLLGFSPETEQFHHHEHNPLSAKLVVVDEASMIDLFLMDRLLAAVSEETHLVLLGDADQLPSVESGAVFRDLVPETCATDTPWRQLAVDPPEARTSEEPTARCAIRLKKSYRMSPDRPRGRHILQVAQWINGNNLEKTTPETRRNFDQLGADPAVGVEHVPLAPDGQPGDLHDFVRHWYDAHLADHPELPALLYRQYGFDGRQFTAQSADALDILAGHIGAARVLTLTRVLERGSERLNEMFHRTHTRRHDFDRRTWERSTDFVPGDPVIVTQNDYEHMLFNGEQGVVVRVDRGDGQRTEPMAVFERRGIYRPFPLAQLAGHLEHAYALTVHKAQGSEYDTVAITLPDEPNALLSRELLYTATTRARKGVVFVGPAAMISHGAATSVERHSGVAEALKPGTSLRSVPS